MGRLARFIRFYTEEDEGGDVGPTSIVSGIPPLRLLNALAKPVKSILQHGKVTVSGTDITCNNGTLTVVDGQIVADGTPEEIVVQGKNLFDPHLWFETGYELTSNGVTLKFLADGGMQISGTNSSSSSADFYVCGAAYGRNLIVPAGDYTISADGLGSNTYVVLSGSGNNGFPYTDMRNTQAFPASVTGTVTDGTKSFSYIIVRVPAGKTADTVVRVQVESGTSKTEWSQYHHQTATAENLFAVENIEDTQDIISGKVTRRTEAVVSDGTTPSGRYVGTVGEGNIIVKARETGYTGEIVSFETEQEKPLTVKVDIEPVQDLHGYDSPWPPGGGKNKFYSSNSNSATLNGVTCSFDANTQTFAINGTNESSSAYILLSVIPTEDIVRNVALSRAFIGAPTGVYINFVYNDGSWHGLSNGEPLPDSVSIENIRVQVGILGTAGSFTTTTFKCQLQEGSTAPTAWSPYSNICPISGWTGCEVWDDPKYGGNIYWSQLVKNGDFASGSSYWAKSTGSDGFAVSDGVATLTLNSVPTNYYGHNFQTTLASGTASHKYFVSALVKASRTGYVAIGITNSSPARNLWGAVVADTWTRIGNILNITGSYNQVQISPGWDFAEWGIGDTISAKDVFVVDLTEAFGAVAANQLFNAEQATAGSGISQVRALFPHDYYPYNAGEETCVSAVNGDPYTKVEVEFPVFSANQWDEEWELGIYNTNGEPVVNTDRIRSKNPIYVEPNTTYYMYCGNNNIGINIHYYNADGTQISMESKKNTTFTTPANTAYILFNTATSDISTYNHDIAINYPSSVTTYNPYTDTVYGGTLTIRNDGSGNIANAYDFVDLSTLTWNLDGDIRMRSRVISYHKDSGWDKPWTDIYADPFKVVDPGISISNMANYSFFNIRQNYYNFNVKVPAGVFADASAFKTWCGNVDGNGTHAFVAIPKVTAQTITLDEEHRITSLEGQNNLWSNGKSISVYVPDREVIESVTAQRLSTAEGDNTITVTAEVDDIVLDVEYRAAEE